MRKLRPVEAKKLLMPVLDSKTNALRLHILHYSAEPTTEITVDPG